jgi:hypothetical protein
MSVHINIGRAVPPAHGIGRETTALHNKGGEVGGGEVKRWGGGEVGRWGGGAGHPRTMAVRTNVYAYI